MPEGVSMTKEEFAASSPQQTQHIKRFGDYVIDLETLPQPILPGAIYSACLANKHYLIEENES